VNIAQNKEGAKNNQKCIKHGREITRSESVRIKILYVLTHLMMHGDHLLFSLQLSHKIE
jgi:hypothetical protein